MNLKQSIEQLAEPIGFDIGHSTNDVQAGFLNGFARAVRYMADSDRSMQYIYIDECLTRDARTVIKELAAIITDGEVANA